jgi:hypothetical protein
MLREFGNVKANWVDSGSEAIMPRIRFLFEVHPAAFRSPTVFPAN